MSKAAPFELSEKMRRINTAYGPPTPEQEECAVRVLQQHDCLDLAPMLGLQVIVAESSNDSKLPGQVVL